MFVRPQHYRRGSYGLARQSPLSRMAKPLLALFAAGLVLYVGGSWTLRLLGVGNAIRQTAAILQVEDRGNVNVSLENQEVQRAQSGMPLYPGDKVSTAGSAAASMMFFDGTWARAGSQTDLGILESVRGDAKSAIAITLARGQVWIETPAQAAYSGAIVRTIASADFTAELPPGTQAAIAARALTVYAAAGEGIKVHVGKRDPIVIGEGQSWQLPAGTPGKDLYAYRTPIDAKAGADPFVAESRTARGTVLAASGKKPGASALLADILTLTSPKDNQTLTRQTFVVSGTVSPDVAQVQVNGKAAVLDKDKHTFAQELAPPDGETSFSVHVQALDANGKTLSEADRMLKRAAASASPIAFSTPIAGTGGVYRTNDAEVIIRGTSPKAAAGIMVNDYALRLFTPEKGTWSYDASLPNGNMKAGENIYKVYMLNADGTKSAPAVLTIVQGRGDAASIVSGNPFQASLLSSSSAKSLPDNAPTEPGSLSVTEPQAATPYAVPDGTLEFMLKGETSKKSATVSVNGYDLQLYKAGDASWQYLVSAKIKTMKRGTNRFTVIARDKAGKILDKLTYTVEFHPGRAGEAASASASAQGGSSKSSANP